MASVTPPDSPTRTLDFYECLETCQLGEVAKRIGEAVVNFFVAIAKGIYSGISWVCQKIYSLATCASEEATSESPPEGIYLSPLPAPEPRSAPPPPPAQQDTISPEDQAAIDAALCEDDDFLNGGAATQQQRGNRTEPSASPARATAAQRSRPPQPRPPSEQNSQQHATLSPNGNRVHLQHVPTPSELDALLGSGKSVHISFPGDSSNSGAIIQQQRGNRTEPSASPARATAAQRSRPPQPRFASEQSSRQRTTLPSNSNRVHLQNPTPSEVNDLLRSGQSVEISFPTESPEITSRYSADGQFEKTLMQTTRRSNGVVETHTIYESRRSNTQHTRSDYSAPLEAPEGRFELQLGAHRQQIWVELVD